jgi:predicted regulator of amino acid metabolism with ACT domain
MGSKTINTEIKRLLDEGIKLSTSVKNIEIRITDNATALKMDRNTALELAEKIITFAHITEEDNRINLTVPRDENRVTITSY